MSDARSDDLPAHLQDTAAAQAWLSVYDHGSVTRGWHPADVEWALGEAHRALRDLGSRIGPAAAKGFWPPIVKEAEDFIHATRTRRYSPSEVSTMNAALGWAWAFLRELENERRSLALWCFCKEHGIPYAKLMREMGLVRQTENYRRQRAMLYVAAALCRAETPVPYEVLIGRLDRKGSDMRDDRDELAVKAQHAAPELVAAGPEIPPEFAPVSTLWAALIDASDGDAALALIFGRVRAEAEAGFLAGPEALALRLSKLTAEAARRGLIAQASAKRTLKLSRDELTARIEANKETA
jgi:hypothetical protein